MQWSNADIEFPSTSTSDEIEIISQTDDETICKLLSALPVAGNTDQIQDDNTTLEEDATIAAQSSAEITAASESGRVLEQLYRSLYKSYRHIISVYVLS